MSPLPPPIGDEPTRVCRRCSAQAQTSSLNCPHCGGSYLRGFRGLKRGAKIATIVLPLLLMLVAAGSAAAMKVHHDNTVKHQREVAQQRADAQRKKREAAARARAEKQRAQEALDQIKIDERKLIETELRRAITKDANEKADQGLLSPSGLITHTRCNPIAGGSNSLAEPTARYDCMAVDKTNADGTESGYGYTGTINFDKGSYTWQLGNG